jgi:hypothetical protein
MVVDTDNADDTDNDTDDNIMLILMILTSKYK